MRVFVGIKLDDAVVEKINNALKPFKKISTPIKWVKPENIHLTLKFIGEISGERKDELSSRLKHTRFQSGPIPIGISGFGKFGKGNNLNIFWAGIDDSNPLEQVYHQIEHTLDEMGIEKETRKFKPHLTLGRNKKNFNFKSMLTLIDQYLDLPIARFTASGFQIFESTLTPGGPRHTILEEVDFSNA